MPFFYSFDRSGDRSPAGTRLETARLSLTGWPVLFSVRSSARFLTPSKARSPALACLLVAVLAACLSACGSSRSITPSERVQPIETSTAATEKQAQQEREVGTDANAISLARQMADNDYHIGPDDVLEINVFQVEDLSGEYTVNGKGELNMPLIGKVLVAGLTAEDIENALEVMYEQDYLVDPDITVRVTEYQSQQITVLGEVNVPGMYPLKGQTTLMEALALARGVNRIANLEQVIIFREEDSVVYGYLVNAEEVMSGARPDPDVFGNDRIMVPEDSSASFLRSISVGVPGFGGYRQY